MSFFRVQLGVILLFHLSSQPAQSEEIFRSIARLRILVSVERELIQALQKYINVSRDLFRTGEAPMHYPLITGEIINLYQRRLEDVRKISDAAVADVDVHVTHPVQAFQLLKRYMKLWNYVRNGIDKDVGKDILEILERNHHVLPNDTDFIGACRAITRLQSTYKISVRDMADGRLPGEKHGACNGLTVDDCFFIGQEAFSAKDDHYCLSWMEEALRRYREGYPVMPWEDAKESTIVEFLAFCYSRAGLYYKAVRFTDELLTLDPENIHGLQNKPIFAEELLKTQRSAQEEPLYPAVEENHYHRCCRGEAPQTHVVQPPELVCRYLSGHPLIRFQGIGEEVLNTNPRIVMFRGLLDDQEAEIMKRLALPHLTTSRTAATSQNDTLGKVFEERVSNTAWLSDEEYPDSIIPKITERLEMVTGLSADAAEPYQVLNYGIGGHYVPHLDADSNSVMQAVQERIATLLIYLSDVEYGGGTVFVKHGVRASPKKGDATFWYNMHRSGEVDLSTEHGGCPVLLGEKWIINKWFNYYGQMFHRKCGLSPEE